MARINTKPLSARPSREMLERFTDTLAGAPDFLVRSPARVHLIGAYSAASGGRSLSVAIDRFVWLGVQRLPATLVTVHAFDQRLVEVVFRLTELDSQRALDGQPLPGWARYVAGVAWSLQESGLATPGSRLALFSDIPAGAHLGTSSAVEAACAVAWAHITGWEVERIELALLCRQAEQGYVGSAANLADPAACLFGREHRALAFDTQSFEMRQHRLGDDVALLIVDAGAPPPPAKWQLRERQAAAERALEALLTAAPELRALRDLSTEAFDSIAEFVPEQDRAWARFLVEEDARVGAAVRALRAGEAAVAGAVMDESFRGLQAALGGLDPAIEALWQAAEDHPARLGGNLAGNSPAGSLVFLVEAAGAEDFAQALHRRYLAATGRQAASYAAGPVEGAQIQMDRTG